MIEELHAGAVLPAAIAACCTLANRRTQRVLLAASSLLMVAAMLDLWLGVLRVPGAVWALALIVMGIAVAATIRHPGGAATANPGATTRRDGSRAGMTAHAGLGLIIMGALVLMMPSAGSAAPTVSTPMAGMDHGAGSMLLPVVVVAVVVFLVFTLRLAAHLSRGPGRDVLTAVEPASMGVSTAVMAAALLL